MSPTNLTRRSFMKASALAAGAAALGSGVATVNNLVESDQAYAADEVKLVHTSCRACISNCGIIAHVQNGRVIKLEGDPADPMSEGRVCPKGLSGIQALYHPNRNKYPMKRVGERGGNQWERISWEEAIDTIADALMDMKDKTGLEGLLCSTGGGGNPQFFSPPRFRNFWGAGNVFEPGCAQCYLPRMGASQLSNGMGKPNNLSFSDSNGWDYYFTDSPVDSLVLWGTDPSNSSVATGGRALAELRAREKGLKTVVIDPRMTMDAAKAEVWLPIRPGTDAALASAIAHEWIANDQVDKEFLDAYCVGFDEDTMPESAKGQNKSYKDYIMGTGYDMVEKTAEWAAPITGIPAERIKQLAADIAAAEAPFICQGWGPQRHTNGEDTSRAICMLPVLIGKIGLPGTNTGQREAEPPTYLVGSLPFENPIKTAIPVYQWINAVDHGKEMTATNAGIVGADKLNNDIKFLWNYAGNCITNQHGDINYTHDVLADESKLEFILVWDTVMTDSAKYADILLPDAMRSEQLNMQTQGYSEYYTAVVVGGPAQEAPGECRSSYDVCADIADKFGKKDAFTEGKTQEDWIKELYEAGAKADGNMPTWDEIKEQGVYKRPLEPAIGLVDFRTDPVKNPLSTPSGKIEIYSEQLAEIAATWELEEGDVINPIPVFTPGFQGYGSVTDEYPLYCTGFHHKSRTHSSFGFIPELEQVARQQLWINPADAESRGIASGDTVAVKSPAGEIRIEALVTPRIIPGTIGIPQGAWHKADMNGDRVDEVACVNPLTTYRPTPLAKGNGPAHSIIAQITKA